MISGEYYKIIFYIIVLISTLLIITKLQDNRNFEQHSHEDNRVAIILAIIFSLFIGFRPISMEFVDMVAYAARYDWLQFSDITFRLDTDNWIFDNLILFSAINGYTKQFFFFVIAFIYYFASYFAIRRIFRDNVLAAYLIWLGSFSTFSYGVNGIKAGAAAALFLVALSFYDKKLFAFAFSVISLGFHHSMILCVIAYIIVLFVKSPKYYLIFWFFCFIIAALHILYFQKLFGSYSDEQGSQYLLTTSGDSFGGQGGFRIDFILYSAVPIIIGYITLFKKKLVSEKYTILYNFYLLTNGIWMLCMYASFTNRIAYLSWFVYPIVLIYPILEMKWGVNRPIVFRYLAFGNIAFTLFMTFIYS